MIFEQHSKITVSLLGCQAFLDEKKKKISELQFQLVENLVTTQLFLFILW